MLLRIIRKANWKYLTKQELIQIERNLEYFMAVCVSVTNTTKKKNKKTGNKKDPLQTEVEKLLDQIQAKLRKMDSDSEDWSISFVF